MSLVIPQIDVEFVDALNHLLGPAQSSTFAQSGDDFDWCWRSKFADVDLPSTGIKLESEENKIIYWPVWDPPSELVADVDLNAFEGSAKLLAASLRYSLFLEHLCRISGQSWLPTELVTRAPSGAAVHNAYAAGFNIYGPTKELLFQGQLAFEAGSFNLVRHIQGIAGKRALAIENIPLRVSVLLSSVTITANKLEQLIVNSAIVVGDCHGGKIPVLLHSACSQYEAVATLEGGLITVEDFFKPNLPEATDTKRGLPMDTSNEELTDIQDTKQSVKSTNVPVELSFEIGSLTVTLGELETVLRSGYTFNLNQELKADSVVVNANGAPIAKGELLKIGELLAVRITEIQ